MSRYRIVTNGELYRVERKVKFLWWEYWQVAMCQAEFCRFEYEFSTRDDAERHMKRLMRDDECAEHGWQPVR